MAQPDTTIELEMIMWITYIVFAICVYSFNNFKIDSKLILVIVKHLQIWKNVFKKIIKNLLHFNRDFLQIYNFY